MTKTIAPYHTQSDGKQRFYIPVAIAEQIDWPAHAELTCVEDEDGNILISHDERNFKGRYLRAPYYTMITLPPKFKGDEKRLRLTLVDNKLLVKRF